MTKSTQIRTSAIALTTAAAGLVLASTAIAKPSTPADIRGYQNCLNAAQQETKDMDPTREYLLQTEDNGKTYFINAYQWRNGERVAVRVACNTSPSGRKLHSVAVNEGRYTNQRARVTIEVAQK